MDESWRMRMGMPTRKPSIPRRKSTEERSRRSSETLDPDDFNDVFGGPPRSVLSRQFSSGDFTRSTVFYEEIFHQPEDVAPSIIGRNLPEFRIPAGIGRRSEEFYSDIFGKVDVGALRRSRSRSKSNSSSLLSSEDLSPLRPAIADDDVSFSAFASKLRPLNVPCRWNSSTMILQEGHPKQQGFMATFSCHRPSYIENEYNENCEGSHFGFSRRVSSPETINLEPNSYRSTAKVSLDDVEVNSPSSVVSSLCQDQEVGACKIQDEVLEELSMEQEEDEVMSSYVIEINSDHRERSGEAQAIDEAIAWAKEKFQTHSIPEKDWSTRQHETEQLAVVEDVQIDGPGSTLPVDKKPNKCATEEEKQQLRRDMEMELLDEDIRLWSTGKDANIQMLLSTLHHILWPNSGWYPISLANLVESSHVKKAYQKARLCLHPDKLQQRAATLPQKYVAEKAFSILQDAWAAFIPQDVFLN